MKTKKIDVADDEIKLNVEYMTNYSIPSSKKIFLDEKKEEKMNNLKYVKSLSADCYYNNYTLKCFKNENSYYLFLVQSYDLNEFFDFLVFKNGDEVIDFFDNYLNDVNAINNVLKYSNKYSYSGKLEYNKKTRTYNVIKKNVIVR